MKKKFIISVILIMMLLLCIGRFYYKNPNLKSQDYRLSDSSDIAIMIYDNNQNRYVNSSSLPVGEYKIDRDLSYCKNNSILNYDYSNGFVQYSIGSADKCYLFFKELYSAMYTSIDSIPLELNIEQSDVIGIMIENIWVEETIVISTVINKTGDTQDLDLAQKYGINSAILLKDLNLYGHLIDLSSSSVNALAKGSNGVYLDNVIEGIFHLPSGVDSSVVMKNVENLSVLGSVATSAFNSPGVVVNGGTNITFDATYINTTSQFSPAVILNNTNDVTFTSVSFIVNESPIIKIIGLPETSCGTIRVGNSDASISGELQDDSVTIDGTNYSLSKTPFLVVDGCDLDASEISHIAVSEEYYWVELINGATISNVGAMTYDNGLIVKDNGTYRKL